MARSGRRVLLLAFAAIAVSSPASAQHLSFLACPVAQDLGPDRDLCFFTVHEGVRYGLSGPPDWGNPQLGHLVLVEAVVADGPQECGGVPIEGRVSVMPELSPECDEIVPPTPEFLAEPLPARSILTEADRIAIEADPAKSLQIVRLPLFPVPEVALGRTETIYFPFESDRASGPDALLMLELARLAASTPDVRVMIRAYQGATLLDDGRVLAERGDMARTRGEKIAAILSGLGAPEAAIETEIVDTATAPDGKDDWKNRKAELRVTV